MQITFILNESQTLNESFKSKLYNLVGSFIILISNAKATKVDNQGYKLNSPPKGFRSSDLEDRRSKADIKSPMSWDYVNSNYLSNRDLDRSVNIKMLFDKIVEAVRGQSQSMVSDEFLYKLRECVKTSDFTEFYRLLATEMKNIQLNDYESIDDYNLL